MYRGPAVDELMRLHKPRKGRSIAFPPSVNGQVIKQWTVKSAPNTPGSWYTRTCALKPEAKEAITPSLSKEIEDALGPELFGVYSRNLRVKVATDGRGAACTGTSVPALPRPPLTPGRPLEKSGTLKRRPASSSDAPADPAGAREIETHQVTWTSCGPIPSHSYVEAERIDSLDEWFARFGRPADLLGQHAHTKWTPSRRQIGGARSNVVAMKPGNMTR